MILVELAVEEEHRAFLCALEHVNALEEAELVASNKVGTRNQVAGTDGTRAEAQVRGGDGAGFLRVVNEVSLSVVLRVLTDDLDGILVRAHGAIGTKSVEEGADRAGIFGGELGVKGKRVVGHIVVNTDGEVVVGHGFGEIVEDGLDHRGGELLGGETVAATDEARHGGDFAGGEALGNGSQNLLIKRLSDGAGLLGAIKHGDGASRGRKRRQEVLDGEGTDTGGL